MNKNEKEIHYLFELYKNAKNKEEREQCYYNIYRKYNKLVKRIAFSIIKNEHDSEDIVQNVFIKIYNIKNSIPSQNEYSWLYSITKNTTIDYLRKQKNTINIDDLYNLQTKNNEIDDLIEYEKYEKIISRLSLEEQEIVSLKILSNLTFKEIGILLNMPTATVSWKYYKAINTLKLFISNLLLCIVALGSYLINKGNMPRSEIDLIIQKHNTVNNILLAFTLIFAITSIDFLIILKKYHKNYNNYSCK